MKSVTSNKPGYYEDCCGLRSPRYLADTNMQEKTRRKKFQEGVNRQEYYVNKFFIKVNKALCKI